MSYSRQQQLEQNLIIFLQAAGEENLHKYSLGLCNALAFMNFRAHFLQNESINDKRIKDYLSLTKSQLDEMGNLLYKYKKIYRDAIGVHCKDKKIAEINSNLKELTKTIAASKEASDFSDDMQIIEAKISTQRNTRDKLIQDYFQRELKLPDLNQLVEAEKLYFYIHTLSTVFNPGFDLSLVDEKNNPIQQYDFDTIFKTFWPEEQPTASDDSLKEKKENITEIKKTLEFAFNFTNEEFELLLGNKYHDQTFLDKDFIRISNGNHVISMRYNNGVFTLFDPDEVKIEPYSTKNLVSFIRKSFDKNFGEAETMSLGIVVFSNIKIDEINKIKPTRIYLAERIIKGNPDKNLNAISWSHTTGTWLAASFGHYDTLEYLGKQSHTDFNIARNDGTTPAAIAAYYGYANVIEYLAGKADLNKKNHEGRTPAYLAAQNGRISVIKKLLDAKVDFNMGDVHNFTPLFISCQTGNHDIVEILVNNPNIKLNPYTKVKTSVLEQFAAEKKETLKLIVKSKNIKETISDFTPIHIAAFFGHAEVVEVLIAAGANPYQMAEYKLTPLILAHEMKASRVISLLNPKKLLKIAVDSQNAKLVYDLHEHSLNLNCIIQGGKTALHFAVSSNALSVVNALLNCGASTDIQDDNGVKPFNGSFGEVYALFTLHNLKNILINIPVNSKNKFIIKNQLNIIKTAELTNEWQKSLNEIKSIMLAIQEDMMCEEKDSLPTEYINLFPNKINYKNLLERCFNNIIKQNITHPLNKIVQYLLNPELNHLIIFKFKNQNLWVEMENPYTHEVQLENLSILLKSRTMNSLNIPFDLLDNYIAYVEEFETELSIEDLEKLKECKGTSIMSHLAFAYSAAIYSTTAYDPMVKLMQGNMAFLQEKAREMDAISFQVLCAKHLRNILVLNASLIYLRNNSDKTIHPPLQTFRVESTSDYMPPTVSSNLSFYSTSSAGLRFLERSISTPDIKQVITLPSTPGVAIDLVSKYPDEKEILVPAGDVIVRTQLKEIQGTYHLRILPKSRKPLITKGSLYNLDDYKNDEFREVQITIPGLNVITVLPLSDECYIYRLNIIDKDVYLMDKAGPKTLIKKYQLYREADIANRVVNHVLECVRKSLGSGIIENESKKLKVNASSLELQNTAYILREGKIDHHYPTLQQSSATEALYYVSEHFFAEDMRYGDEQEYFEDAYTVVNDTVIYKSNHGLAHTGRTMDYILKLIFPLFCHHAKQKEIFIELFENFAILDEILIASAFLSVGRDSEAGFDTDNEKYKRYRKQCRNAFLSFSKKYPSYFRELTVDHVPSSVERVIAYADCIEHLGDPKYTNLLPGFTYHVMQLFLCAHLLDSYRCFDQHFVENLFLERMEKVLDVNSLSFKAKLDKIRKYIAEALERTGDRRVGILGKSEYKHYTNKFIRCSREPNFLLQQLESLDSPFRENDSINYNNLILLANLILKDAETIDLSLFLIRMLQRPYLYELIRTASPHPEAVIKSRDNSKAGIVSTILDKKIDPNITDKRGVSALHVAAALGEEDVARVLLSRKADPNLKTRLGHCVIEVATHSSQWGIIKLLEDHKLPHSKESKFALCVNYVKQGDLAALNKLLQQNLSLLTDLFEYENSNGDNLLNIAAANDQPDIIKWLLEKGFKPILNLQQVDALGLAAKFEYASVVKILLEAKCYSEELINVYIYCCMDNKINLLLDLLSDEFFDLSLLTIKTKEGITLEKLLIKLFVQNDMQCFNKLQLYQPALATILLENKSVYILFLDKYFKLIAESNYLQLLEFKKLKSISFLQQYIIPNSLEISGIPMTPLQFAVGKGNFDIIKDIMDMDDKPYSEFASELTTLIVSQAYKLSTINFIHLFRKFKELLAGQINEEQAEVLAKQIGPDFIKSARHDIFKLKEFKTCFPPLVLKKLYTYKDEFGNTALHYAVWERNVDMVKELIVPKYALNELSANNSTPVYLAVEQCSSVILKMLIDAKPDPKIALETKTTHQNLTPLEKANELKDSRIENLLFTLYSDQSKLLSDLKLHIRRLLILEDYYEVAYYLNTYSLIINLDTPLDQYDSSYTIFDVMQRRILPYLNHPDNLLKLRSIQDAYEMQFDLFKKRLNSDNHESIRDALLKYKQAQDALAICDLITCFPEVMDKQWFDHEGILHLAVNLSYEMLVNILLSKFINIKINCELIFLAIKTLPISYFIKLYGMVTDFKDEAIVNNKTLLMHAIDIQNKSVVEFLLTKEFDPNIQIDDNPTALHYAVDKRRIDIVRMLLRVNANPNLSAVFHKFSPVAITPLQLACHTEDFDIAKVLISGGASQEAVQDILLAKIEKYIDALDYENILKIFNNFPAVTLDSSFFKLSLLKHKFLSETQLFLKEEKIPLLTIRHLIHQTVLDNILNSDNLEFLNELNTFLPSLVEEKYQIFASSIATKYLNENDKSFDKNFNIIMQLNKDLRSKLFSEMRINDWIGKALMLAMNFSDPGDVYERWNLISMTADYPITQAILNYTDKDGYTILEIARIKNSPILDKLEERANDLDELLIFDQQKKGALLLVDEWASIENSPNTPRGLGLKSLKQKINTASSEYDLDAKIEKFKELDSHIKNLKESKVQANFAEAYHAYSKNCPHYEIIDQLNSSFQKSISTSFFNQKPKERFPSTYKQSDKPNFTGQISIRKKLRG